MSKIFLKPCPICGEDVEIVITKENDGFEFYNISCINNLECDFRMSNFYDKEYMVLTWNTRTIEDELLKHISNLKSFISQTMLSQEFSPGEIAEQLQELEA